MNLSKMSISPAKPSSSSISVGVIVFPKGKIVHLDTLTVILLTENH